MPRGPGCFLGIGVGPVGFEFHAASLSSLSAPRMTILSASSGSGRCNAFASSHGARIIHRALRLSSGLPAWPWDGSGSTTAFGEVVRKP